jgi:hypothetical protein
MAEHEKTLKRADSETRQNRNKIALAIAKRAARSELKRIFDDEVTQWTLEQQQTRSRTATASDHP